MISATWIDRDCFAALAMTAFLTFYEIIKIKPTIKGTDDA
jgi:hypothetical protein